MKNKQLLTLVTLIILAIILTSHKSEIKNEDSIPTGTAHIKDNLYMDINEVTNSSYHNYLNWIKDNFGKESIEYKNALPDTNAWDKIGNRDYYFQMVEISRGIYKKLYFRHTEYGDFPVVCVSHKQAEAFCIWRTNQENRKIYMELNKLNKVPEKTEIPKYIKYRLPNKEEWEFAAIAGNKNIYPYPWGSFNITDDKGELLLNCSDLGAERIYYDQNTKEYHVIVRKFGYNNFPEICEKVKSYPANNFGLFDMSGNVSELVSDTTITKGGSWLMPGYNCRIDVDGLYSGPYADTGFRCICEKLIEY